jgi:uncharacterized protein YydD (DUF2326 family)
MIHRIYSSLPTFKNLEFRDGFNLLVVERHQSSGDLQTRNRAGKTSIIEIVHFLLGGNADKNSIFRNAELSNAVFGMEFDLGPGRVVAERMGNSSRTVIKEADTHDWPKDPSNRAGLFNSYSLKDWREVLGTLWFGLEAAEPPIKYRPSFRSMLSYFVRRENADGMRRPEMNSKNQQVWDQHVSVAFLLDLDWLIGVEWQKIRDNETTLKELKHASAEGAFGDIISTTAQLRTELVLAEQGFSRIQSAVERFEVLPEYRELEREASVLTQQLMSASDENALDREIVETIGRSFENDLPPNQEDLERLYAESGVVLGDSVRRRFDEVERFHASIISNRRSYLESEYNAARARIENRESAITKIDRRRAEIMVTLQSKGALDQFQKLQAEWGRTGAKIETLKQRYQAAQTLEGTQSELKFSRGNLLQRLRRDLDEQGDRVKSAITAFQVISNALYEDAGNLLLVDSENGLKISVRIQGQRSRGIQNMQVFCFDMMLMQLCADRGIGPGFLIHDSHLFDGVDERQVGKALSVGEQTARRCGWQYIVTMNEDVLPKSLPEDFNLEQWMLPTRLNDGEEDGGLFGFRFQ